MSCLSRDASSDGIELRFVPQTRCSSSSMSVKTYAILLLSFMVTEIDFHDLSYLVKASILARAAPRQPGTILSPEHV